MIGLEMSLDELLALPVSVDLVTAGRAFGLGRTKSFELAQVGEFPCRVLKVGLRYRVPRSSILEALGIDAADVPATATDDQEPASSRPETRRSDHRPGRTRQVARADEPAAATG